MDSVVEKTVKISLSSLSYTDMFLDSEVLSLK